MNLLPYQVKAWTSCGCEVRKRLAAAKPLPKADRVLALDPGTANFAVSIIENGRVRGTYMLRNPVKAIRDKTLQQDIAAFEAEFMDLLRVFRPHTVIAERFMARRFSTQTTEIVGLMCGLMAMMARHAGAFYKLLPSSHWKPAIKRRGVDLDGVYQNAAAINLPPHPVDASCIGYFSLNELHFGDDVKTWVTKNLNRCANEIL